MAPRTSYEITAGINEAAAVLASNSDIAIAAYILGVPVEDVQRVSGPAK